MTECAVTVIMPVYKTKNTLKRAVESIVAQTMENWELIMVDDCSPDDSGEFADKLAENDSRIIVIHKPKNEGLAMARNTAFDNASGEYVTFIDSDDWLEPDTLRKVYDKAKLNDADVAVYGYSQDEQGENGETVPGITVLPTEKILKNADEVMNYIPVMDREKVFAYTTNKMYKRQFLLDCGVRAVHVKLIEDILFNIDVFGYVQRVCLIPESFYHYMKYSTQTLTSVYIPEYFDIINMRYKKMKALYEKNNMYTGDIRSGCANVHLKHVATVFERSCSKESGKSFKDRVNEAKEVLSHPYTQEAIQYCKAVTKQEKLINKVICSKNATLCAMFGSALYFAKNKMTGLFDKIK